MNGKLGTMTIQLSPETEALIQELMDRGDYAHPAAVIDDALRVLVERDQSTRLKAAIAVGIEQYERGETIPWTPDYIDRMKREAEGMARSGKPIKDEVKHSHTAREDGSSQISRSSRMTGNSLLER
jgi:antitoxin ParD1/3/4